MIDGRHTGTGGGNHVVLGGPMPGDSPFLRRPDLLRSMVGYFVNHPSLSYFFSGMFVGPTSQAPRIDEARQESVDELELAFRRGRPSPAGQSPPWLVDRIFRNLLVDVTGNTHRAEMCIDKLFSPDSASGRQGLLELRAFEMPPHARMSLAQQLLLRGRWSPRSGAQPYRRPPGPLGDGAARSLHAAALPGAGLRRRARRSARRRLPVQATEWFRAAPRLPLPARGARDRRRRGAGAAPGDRALAVIGEEAERGRAGPLRRLVGRAAGGESAGDHRPDRYVIACNQQPRRRCTRPAPAASWSPACATAPGSRRARCTRASACTRRWPSTHRHLDRPRDRRLHLLRLAPGRPRPRRTPANALEAEGRRIARFFAFGHTPGAQQPPPEERNPDFPLTLDLRRPTG